MMETLKRNQPAKKEYGTNSTRWGKTIRNCMEKIKDLNKKKENLILDPEANAMNLVTII